MKALVSVRERELAIWIAGLRRIAVEAVDGGDASSWSAAVALSHFLREEVLRRKKILGRRVLVVEDDEAIRRLVNMTLTDDGYEVLEAVDGATALTISRQARPHVILLDMYMPGMSARDFAFAYRRTCVRHAPIMLLTVSDDIEQSARDIGAVAFLRKPFDLDDLLHRVRMVTGGR